MNRMIIGAAALTMSVLARLSRKGLRGADFAFRKALFDVSGDSETGIHG